MTSLHQDVVPPFDTDYVDDWERAQDGKPVYRFVWSKPFDSDSGLNIRIVAVQYEDGTIADAEGDEAPLVYIADTEHRVDDARALAAAILRAADQADKWAGVQR